MTVARHTKNEAAWLDVNFDKRYKVEKFMLNPWSLRKDGLRIPGVLKAG